VPSKNCDCVAPRLIVRRLIRGAAAIAIIIFIASGQCDATAAIPELWKPPQDRRGPIDFASGPQADAWLRHCVLGDPSFDGFQRRAGNPIVRGKPPFLWPVNGFLFEDPKSGSWYAYVGHYLAGYDIGPGLPPMHCRVYRSTDRGKAWQELGPIFDDRKFHFQGDSQPANLAPDVTVVFAEGRYHLAYDWATDNSTWANIRHPPKDADSGCAYAWSERPEGPFHRVAKPIIRTSEIPSRLTHGQKYGRAYGPTIVRRKSDWLVLAPVDSDQSFAWGIVAMTARDPAATWSKPVMMLSAESDGFFPSLAESYPAMVHDGYVYVSCSSVALNRDFQIVYRAPIEEAHRPEAWQLFQHGTAWHSEPVANEGVGLWGQSYSGFVDRDGRFQVLFPSRERETNVGTINLADRPWNRPLRERGFTLGGYGGPSLTLLRYAWPRFRLKADLALRGGSARIIWNHQAPLGADRHSSDATLHPLALTRHQGLELSADAWRVVSVDAAGKVAVVAAGALPPGQARSVEIVAEEDGRTQIAIDGKPRWQGNLAGGPGPIGLLVQPNTNLAVSRFEIDGPFKPAVFPWLGIEALTGAGVTMTDWDAGPSPLYRFGVGAVRNVSGGRAKWNFRGRGFQLWAPKGPNFGRCELLLDGKKLAELDLHADREQHSQIVYKCDDADDGYHAVVLRSLDGRLVVDSLDVLN
jgi:hypothetical protein